MTSQARVDQPGYLGAVTKETSCLIKHALPAQRIFERPLSLADKAGGAVSALDGGLRGNMAGCERSACQ